MRQCWHADSYERPTFADIISRIDHRLRKITASNYDYVEAVNDYYVSRSRSSNDCTLFTALLHPRHGSRLTRSRLIRFRPLAISVFT